MPVFITVQPQPTTPLILIAQPAMSLVLQFHLESFLRLIKDNHGRVKTHSADMCSLTYLMSMVS